MTKKSKKYRGQTIIGISPAKGFDLGEQQTVMGIADFTFIEHLNRAKVFACGYGSQAVEGVDARVPFLALVGEEPSGFEDAFKVFSDWGCETDGDVVDVQMMLRNDGEYDLWVGPEIERALLRIVPEAGLHRANFFNVAWIKHLDSTNPAIEQLSDYITSAISPLIFTAAIGDPKTATSKNPDFKFVDGLPGVMKFDMKIRSERENPDDRRFHVGDYDVPLNERDDPRRAMSPFTYCWRRKKTIDIAFPVSRERVRRSDLIARVRGLPGYADVSETQVVQAVINLILSNEISPGDQHYSKLSTNDVADVVWRHISARKEWANNKSHLKSFDLSVVARQIDLDVRHVLRQRGVPVSASRFTSLQGLFRRKGYIDD